MEHKKNVLYICQYYLDDVIAQRNSTPYISQAGMNKANFMIETMEACGCRVYVLSNAWTNSRSFKVYKGFSSQQREGLYYSGIVGLPFVNAYSCLVSGKKFIRTFLKSHSIDLVVFYNMRLENSALVSYIKKKYHIPVVLEYEDGVEQDVNNSSFKQAIYRHVEARIKPLLDGVILVNGIAGRRFSCPQTVIRGAARPTDARWEPLPAGERPRFLFAGTLDEQRGIEVVLEALRHTDLNCEVLISGKGPLEKLVEDCRDERVRYLGFVSYEEYRANLKSAHICINAQKSSAAFSKVSFPSKLFEYLSAGKLVISSDVADVEEYMGDCVRIYHGDDPDALARQMEQSVEILRDPKRLAVYEKTAKACLNRNTKEKISAQLGALFDQMIGEKA